MKLKRELSFKLSGNVKLRYTLPLLSILITCSLNAQKIPISPNQIDTDGKRQNKWTILYDQDWNIIQDKSKAAFYRLITYKDDKPMGKVFDMYANGKKQMETNLLADRPQDVMNGETSFYREDGSKEKLQVYLNGILTDEINYHPDGSIVFENWKRLDSLATLYESQRDYFLAFEAWNKARLKAAKEFGRAHANYVKTVINLGHVCVATGNYAMAEAFHSEALKIQTEILGAQNLACGKTLMNLSQIATQMGDYQKAERQTVKAISIFKSSKEYFTYTKAIRVLGERYIYLKMFEKGEQMFTEALYFLEQNSGKENPMYASTLAVFGELYRVWGKYEKAEPIMLENCAILKNIQDPSYTTALVNLAILYKLKGPKQESERLFIEAVEIQKRMYGSQNSTYANTLKNLADMYTTYGDYNKAEPLYEQALQIQKSTLGENHPNYRQTLYSLATLYENMVDYPKAELVYLNALKIVNETLGDKHIEYADVLSKLVNFYVYQADDYAKAEAAALESLNVFEMVLGKNHPAYARQLSNLARIYQGAGDYRKAEKLYLQALDILEQALGSEHPDCALTMNNLANVYESLKDPRAEAFLQKSITINKNVFGARSEQYAYGLSNLATFYQGIQQFSKAELLFNEALEIQKVVLGELSQDYLGTTFNLASLNGQLKNYERSESLWLEFIRLWRDAYGTTGQEYARGLGSAADFYYHVGEFKKAETYFKESSELLLAQFDRKFNSMTENEKGLFLKQLDNAFEKFALFTYEAFEKDVNTVGWLYNNTLATKALLLNSQNKMRTRILSSNDTLLRARYNDWQGTRNRLAQSYQMSKEEKLNKGIDELELEERANQLEKELTKASEFFAQATDKKRYTWQDVQKRLKKGEVAVEIIRFTNAATNVNSADSIYYAALIVTPQTLNNPDMLVLENGKDLEGKFIHNYKNSITFQKADERSYDQYWKEINDRVKTTYKAKRVYFSPDGVYNQINLNTLLNPQTRKYLHDELDIRLVSNTKDLISRPRKVKRLVIDNGVFIGYPDYNGKQKNDSTVFKDSNRSFSPYLSGPFRLDSTQRFFDGETVQELPGTKVEVENIISIFKRNSIDSKEYIAQAATEELVKSLNSPQILHIATHGFFLPKKELSSNGRGPMGIEEVTLNANPLLRSGLLFAGANESLKGKADEGVLTSYEAMNLDIENTELVILSACETGLGEIQNGEGVYGLQRAFQVAGAKAILMSLWKVSDEATKDLMTYFYENWITKKQEKREAFTSAQKQVRVKYPSPYYWGAFVMVGE